MTNSLPTAATRERLEAVVERYPFDDTQDFEDSDRGLVARSSVRQIAADDGRVVWDLDAYSFLDGPAPDTVNPSLWRQCQLCAKDGLYEVVPGVYQVRGFDISNVTFIEGETGVVVIDPLTGKENAEAALALYTEHRGMRPISAMIYTHTHADHFGGVKGIIAQAQVDSGEVPVVAPEGFMDHAISENVFAGTAMARRAGYMFGAALPKSPVGQVGAGLGQTVSTGELTLIPPTVDVTHTGQELVLDGVRMVFQMTPGTEAPVEMNFYLPDHGALCMAENTSHNFHNLLTLRGAVVRDAHAWAHYLTETIGLWGDQLEVVFASHHWPTWGRETAVEFLATQRDVYLYLHDQTLRMINQGHVASEIAETLELPPALESAWHVHGYYGSVNHNVKAIYQHYLGWYDGNPARLWQHPPAESAQRYVDALGGVDAAIAKARSAFDEGDYRWTVELLDHVLFFEESTEAAALQADAFEQLGFGAENGPWRNVFLSGAHELRHGNFGTPTVTASVDVMSALTVAQTFDSIAIRVDGPRAWNDHIEIGWAITDSDTNHICELRNGVLNHRSAVDISSLNTRFKLSRQTLIALFSGMLDLDSAIEAGDVVVEGDLGEFGKLVGLLAPVNPDFAIVTP